METLINCGSNTVVASISLAAAVLLLIALVVIWRKLRKAKITIALGEAENDLTNCAKSILDMNNICQPFTRVPRAQMVEFFLTHRDQLIALIKKDVSDYHQFKKLFTITDPDSHMGAKRGYLKDYISGLVKDSLTTQQLGYIYAGILRAEVINREKETRTKYLILKISHDQTKEESVFIDSVKNELTRLFHVCPDNNEKKLLAVAQIYFEQDKDSLFHEDY